MILVVTIAVALTVAAAFVLAGRLRSPSLALELAADHPVPFGYKMAWLAIRTSDTPAVIDALALRHVQASSWKSGLGAAYDEELGESLLFVSPPVDDWTFVVGLGLPHPLGCRFVDKATPLLLRAERALGLRLFELRGVHARRGDAGGPLLLHPTEDHVMQVAASWSLDPTRIAARWASVGLGYVGVAPQSWRPERLRRAA